MNLEKVEMCMYENNQIDMQLDKLTECFDQLNQKSKSHNSVSVEIQKMVQALAACNETLQDKQFKVDQKMAQKLFNALTNLKVLNLLADRTIQEKVIAQAGLLSLYIKELSKFEINLKKWRIGLKVKDTDPGKNM